MGIELHSPPCKSNGASSELPYFGPKSPCKSVSARPEDPPAAEAVQETLARMAVANAAVDDVRGFAVQYFDSRWSPGRRARLASELAASKADTAEYDLERNRYAAHLRRTEELKIRPLREGLDLANWRRLPWLPIGLLVVVMVASLLNGLFFVEHSGWELSKGKLDALAISAIFSLAPALLCKWALSGLADSLRHRAEAILKAAALPAAFAGLAVFAVVFGQAMEPVSLFDDSSAGFRFPIWLMLGVSMALEALAGVALVSTISGVLREQTPLEVVSSEQYVAFRSRLDAVTAARDRSLARSIGLQEEIHAIDSRRNCFASECVALYQAIKSRLDSQLQLMQSRIRSEAAALTQGLLQQYAHPSSPNFTGE